MTDETPRLSSDVAVQPSTAYEPSRTPKRFATLYTVFAVFFHLAAVKYLFKLCDSAKKVPFSYQLKCRHGVLQFARNLGWVNFRGKLDRRANFYANLAGPRKLLVRLFSLEKAVDTHRDDWQPQISS
jgi:hypothetical protein